MCVYYEPRNTLQHVGLEEIGAEALICIFYIKYDILNILFSTF